MGKIEKYKELIKEVLTKHTEYTPSNMPGVATELIVGEDQNQFIVLDIGWHNKEYYHDWVFHIEIKADKIWVHEDMTDIGIAGELVKQGIDQEDIILGFTSPSNENPSKASAA